MPNKLVTSNKRVLASFLAATVLVAGGSAWAATQMTSPSPTSAKENTAEQDFGKLSADGSRAYQDVALTRLAIYDGRVADAKKLVTDAEAAFTKSKTDDGVFMKAEHALMTPQQMDTRSTSQSQDTGAKAPVSSNAASQKTASDDTAAKDATPDKAIAWLPVDGSIVLDQDYSLNPVKTKAVTDANKSLAQGDRKGALEKLKLADVGVSVALKVVPLASTIDDVHQAVTEIDAGHYYEGSQTLRKLQAAARYDVADIVALPKVASGAAGSPPSPGQTNTQKN